MTIFRDGTLFLPPSSRLTGDDEGKRKMKEGGQGKRTTAASRGHGALDLCSTQERGLKTTERPVFSSQAHERRYDNERVREAHE